MAYSYEDARKTKKAKQARHAKAIRKHGKLSWHQLELRRKGQKGVPGDPVTKQTKKEYFGP